MSKLPRRSVLQKVGGALLILVLVPFIIFAVPGVAGADASFVVLSDSMSPTIEAGDVVIVEETDPATINEGDVITFNADNAADYHDGGITADTTLVTHRVVGIDGAGGDVTFTTQGDANSAPDQQPVSGDQVVGVVAFSIPLIGYVISFAGSQTGMILFVVIPCFLLIVNEVYELATAAESSEPDRQQAD